jgi:hypothetical protein
MDDRLGEDALAGKWAGPVRDDACAHLKLLDGLIQISVGYAGGWRNPQGNDSG